MGGDAKFLRSDEVIGQIDGLLTGAGDIQNGCILARVVVPPGERERQAERLGKKDFVLRVALLLAPGLMLCDRGTPGILAGRPAAALYSDLRGHRAGVNMPNLRLRMRLLGGFSVWIEEKEIPESAFKRRKARSLLKLLALQPGYSLLRDQAMEWLWPELEANASAARLYKAIHYVRNAFLQAEPALSSESFLQLREEVLSLRAPGGVHTDVDSFERMAREARRGPDLVMLQRAIAGYTGELLPADLYEDWSREPREALRQRYMELLLQLGEVHLGLRQLAQAADAFRQLLALDSATEAAHRGLMRVYAEQGNRTRALRQFRLCTETLAQELDVEPEEETSLLCQRIAKGEMRPSGRVGHVTVFESAPLTPFVGRGPESRVVAGVLAALGRGTGAALGLEGTAGIGKTRMVQQVLQLGRQRGYRVLLAGTHQQEGRSAYAPVVGALRMALQTDASHADLIPRELVPSIPEMVPGGTPVPSSDQRNAQIELFAAVLRYLAAESRAAPVVLILDDLHLADSGSLRLFHYLARQTPALPLLLVGTWREPDLVPELASIAGSLERHGLLRRLVLPPLLAPEFPAARSTRFYESPPRASPPPFPGESDRRADRPQPL